MELNGTGTSWDVCCGLVSSQGPQSGGCCTPFFQQHGYANLCAQPNLFLLPRPSQLPSHSRGDARPGGFNPVKPLLLITSDRASSLPAMPAAGWMLLLFLSDLLSLPHPQGISYAACAQLPS